jgi:hypothetical protein
LQDRNEQGLTGVWDGEYSYPRRLSPTRFSAVLLETGADFSGAVHEQPIDGPSAGKVLYASVEGQRTGSQVTFVKVYEDGGTTRRKPVRYEGFLSADGCEVAGVWAIDGSWSGRFFMTRPRRASRKARARRKAVVPAM